jgi:hypothetical protein
MDGKNSEQVKNNRKNVVRVTLVIFVDDRSQRTVRKREFDEVSFRQQEPPNFRVQAKMHLIMILIRWLIGFFNGDRWVSEGNRSCAPSDSGTVGIRRNSNGAYCSGVGVMKIELMLADLEGLLGRKPALALISPKRRDHLRVKPYQPDKIVVDTALLSPNFPPPAPRMQQAGQSHFC